MFVVVAVGCGGRVHFYMIHIFTNLSISPGSFGSIGGNKGKKEKTQSR